MEEMKRSGASYLHGYPSAIALFALTIKQHGLIVPIKIKAILFASETVYEWERRIVEEVFGCRVFSFYGMAEKVVLASECETSHDYHCLPQYGITEIDEKTNEIIGTSFLNYLNPFIRYRTTDVAYGLSDSLCQHCGRHEYPIFSGVEGRLEDFIVTTGGVPVSPAIITHPMKDLKAVKSTQLLQKSLDSIKVKIVPWDQHDPKTLDKEADIIRQGLKGILGVDMKVEIEITQSVQLSATGKFKWVVSDVHKGFPEAIK
ncbi:MAG: phenylacetate--CoA ligase family protein [Deltaproteobacteria bacterium]|nr:phenylacetate--CoA ligase family protein [Deltaproteobacteria bacterium]